MHSDISQLYASYSKHPPDNRSCVSLKSIVVWRPCLGVQSWDMVLFKKEWNKCYIDLCLPLFVFIWLLFCLFVFKHSGLRSCCCTVKTFNATLQLTGWLIWVRFDVFINHRDRQSSAILIIINEAGCGKLDFSDPVLALMMSNPIL